MPPLCRSTTGRHSACSRPCRCWLSWVCATRSSCSPILLFEAIWKLLWLSLVALPKAITGSLDAATIANVYNCSLVLVILAVIPWRYVWRTYVRARGDKWR